MTARVIIYHPMETAPQNGSTLRLQIVPLYSGCPSEVFGSWIEGVGWTCDQPLDSSRDIEPIGWAEP